MTDKLLQLLGAFVACFFFSIIYHAKKKRLALCALSGVVGWSAYLIAEWLQFDYFACYMLAAAVVTLYAELMARFTKTPSTIYLITGILPLVPGGSLYYATSALVANDNAKFNYYSHQTIITALSISVGIIAVTLFFYYFNRYLRNRKVAHGAQS